MRGIQRQRDIYLKGLAGQKPAIPLTYPELEARAKSLLPPEAFAYFAGGAGQEQTMRANREALDQVKIHPHMLGGVQEVSMYLKWRAHTLPAPFLPAPVGVLELAHPKGDLALAEACREMGFPMIISSQASYPMEEIAKKLGNTPRLFQLYHGRNDDVSKSFVHRAEKINASAILVTLDTTLLGWRTRDLTLGFNPFLFGKGIAQYTSDPAFNKLSAPEHNKESKPPFSLSLLRNMWKIHEAAPGDMIHNVRSGRILRDVRKFTSHFANPGFRWDDLERIRTWTNLPIYLKGILRPDDAMKAIRAGVDGIIISNHGGRQVDGAVSSMEALARIKAIAGDQVELWMDSGIRNASDVFKAVAMGARAVLVGRPYAMALACHGAKGIVEYFENLLGELELTMSLSGCGTISDITPDLISHPWKTT